MNLQQGGKSKSSKSSKSKKGGNFLGSVSELFVPTGWENFATAAGLLAIDRADAAFRRSRNSTKKQKGGTDIDGHESIENLENLMQELDTDSTDLEGPQQMNGGGRKTTKKAKTTKTKKPAAKKTTKKGGNFLGAVGELVAPTGWESFATTAGLFALDRADAALRRGTKEKKMKGGDTKCTRNVKYTSEGKEYTVCCTTNGQTKCETRTFKNSQMKNNEIYNLIEESLKRKLNKNKNNKNN